MKRRHLIIAPAILTAVFWGGAGFAQDKVLRFATWDSDESLAIQEAIARKFEEANPGVKVQVEAYGDGYDDKLTAAMGAGDPPDVMYMWNYPSYYQALMPMDDMIARDGEAMNLADIPPGLMNGAVIEGKTYAMPVGFTTHVIFYNKDLLAAAGVAEPAAGWTWADLRAAAAKLSNPGEKTYGFAVDAKPDPFDFEQFFWSNGAQYISDDGKTLDGVMNSPEAAEVLTMFADMVKSGEAIALNIGDETSGSSLFKTGKLAMLEGAMWNKGGIDESGVNYGVAVLPAFGDKPVKSTINASGISIAKDADDPELAWEFVKFFSSPEAVAMRTNDLPIRNSVAESSGKTTDPKFAPFFAMLASGDGTTPAFLKNAEWGRIQENLAVAIEGTMIDQGNAQAHLDEAVAASARFLK
ncbi:sugar ABC transporter substrate-binding protein [Frigidibacter sp. RF13]|uniref:ABC transporter substrate-binding protein n=1 Tax=Frigidibacter sp. RF13 TaxID=2997340 RepID=UPI002270214D|nr:sugar ABC transporter substrate-binding protein [Frigidibacter sp. RF13]MCY1128105.1 sugar ABC transporter substrate-binding protein [Frigidibacter sp. RF13]